MLCMNPVKCFPFPRGSSSAGDKSESEQKQRWVQNTNKKIIKENKCDKCQAQARQKK